MTATGLLCREYLGWDRSDPLLFKGVRPGAERKPGPHPTVGREEMVRNHDSEQTFTAGIPPDDAQTPWSEPRDWRA